MRFSIANLLLLSTALAAPLQQADKKVAKHDKSLVDRGLAPLLERAVPVIPKIIVKPPPGGIHGIEPPPGGIHDVGPPQHITPPGSPDGVTPVDGPDHLVPDDGPNGVKSTKPEDGATGTKSDDTPGLRLNDGDPKPAPGHTVGGCLKRSGKCTLPGADPAQDVDGKYLRESKELTEDEIIEVGDQQYLEDAQLYNADEPGKWYKTTIRNNKETTDKFETDVWPGMETDLKAKGWTPTEISKLKDAITKPARTDILETVQVPEKGLLIVKESWNAEYDLRRAFTGKFGDKEYTRPATQGDDVRWSNQVKDNWDVSAHEAGVESNSLRHIAQDTIATDSTRKTFKNLAGDEENIVLTRDDPRFAAASDTVHTKPVMHMLNDHTELGLRIKQYNIHQEMPSGGGDPTFDLIIDLEPIPA
jgi:hypothetical protein